MRACMKPTRNTESARAGLAAALVAAPRRRFAAALVAAPRRRFAAALVTAIALCSACAAPRAQPAAAPTANAESAAERAQLTELNRSARAHGVVEQVAGLSVDDPYRALEQDSELT